MDRPTVPTLPRGRPTCSTTGSCSPSRGGRESDKHGGEAGATVEGWGNTLPSLSSGQRGLWEPLPQFLG